jgi:predicted nucleic acid-binding protein
MFTIDASVHVNAINVSEEGSQESRAFIEWVKKGALPVCSPTLLFIEVAATLARILDNAEKGIAFAYAIRALPGQTWISLDHLLSEEAAKLGAEYHLRGSDAVYAATALRCHTTLVTRDKQQLERLPTVLSVCTPIEALQLSKH